MTVPKDDFLHHKRAYNRAKTRKMRQYRHEQGLCVACGEPVEIKAMCYECWLRMIATNNGVSGPDRGEKLRILLIQQKYKCALTGEPLILGDNATIDHKVPKSRGGSNDLDNLHWVTWKANMMKTDMTMDELYDLCEIVLSHRKSKLAPVQELKLEEN